jgi:hypothetical protein
VEIAETLRGREDRGGSEGREDRGDRKDRVEVGREDREGRKGRIEFSRKGRDGRVRVEMAKCDIYLSSSHGTHR